MRIRLFLLQSVVLCLTLAAAPPALCQRAVFEGEVTVSATGSKEKVDEVPVPVTVIDREQIDDSQEESVADLLRRVPGVMIMRSGDEGSPTSMFTRGTESDHTLAMFDGVRLNSPYFAGFDWSLLPTAGLERIEVGRGPFSALWGADAIGGVVNVVPMQAENGFEASLVGEGGDNSWQRLEGVVGWASHGFDVYASGFEREGEGELANSDFSNNQILVDAGWSWAEGNRAAVLVQDLSADIGIPFADPLTLTPNRRQTTDQRLIAVPLRVRAGEEWDLELVVSHVEREMSFRDPDDAFGFTASDTTANTLQARLSSRHVLGDHAVTWGGEWRRDEVTDTSNFGTNLDGETTEVGSLFVQDVWQAHPKVRILAGVRWDDAEEWGSEVSPRLSFGWKAGGNFELRAGYGRAFRQPSVGELYFPFSGNPELEPERSESYEFGVTIFAGSSRLQANIFTTTVDNLIEFEYATYAFANVAEAKMQGVELAWGVPLTGTVVSLLQGTWLDTEDPAGETLLRRPEWSASWMIQGRFWKRLRGDLTVILVGARSDVDPVTFQRVDLDSHFTANLALGYRLRGALEILMRVQNIADERYEEVAGYPAPGRRVTGGLRLRL